MKAWYQRVGDGEKVVLLLREILGSGVLIEEGWLEKEMVDYWVVRLRLARPAMEVVVKLAGPRAEYGCPFERTAMWYRLVGRETEVVVPEVLAADEGYGEWPWRYLVMVALPGREWAVVRARVRGEMDERSWRRGYEALGRAVGQLHGIQFEGFGEVGREGKVVGGGRPWGEALRERVRLMLPNERLRDYYFSVLERYGDWLAGIETARLCHEDLHGYNILVAEGWRGWELAGIIDFDKAWAGHHEIDVARMDLWTDMTNEDFWRGYETVAAVGAGYERRRLLYQLLWCLEYGQETEKHLGDTARVCQALGVEVVRGFGGDLAAF